VRGGGGAQATRSGRRLLIVLIVCNAIGKVSSKVKASIILIVRLTNSKTNIL
jgi:hypothetical protein